MSKNSVSQKRGSGAQQSEDGRSVGLSFALLLISRQMCQIIEEQNGSQNYEEDGNQRQSHGTTCIAVQNQPLGSSMNRARVNTRGMNDTLAQQSPAVKVLTELNIAWLR